MANPEHVEILKQGVKVWNKWREKNPGIEPDLREINFSEDRWVTSKIWLEQLSEVSLLGVDFSRTDLYGAVMNGISLSIADLDGACLAGTQMKGTDLFKACLKGAWLRESDMRDANCSGANFSAAYLTNANFKDADLSEANLENANVTNIKFSKATKQKCFKGIRVSTCYGSQRFKTFAQDQDFIEELRDSGKWGKRIFWLWWLFADCGRSFLRWAGWSLLFALSFAALFFFILGPDSFKFAGPPADSFQTMIYYSFVTFTTLGFGDVTPITKGAMWAVMAEVVVGYIMLGGLISILANKLARRS